MRRSVWAPVAYDRFQDQKKFLSQHRPSLLKPMKALCCEVLGWNGFSSGGSLLMEPSPWRACATALFQPVKMRINAARIFIIVRNFRDRPNSSLGR
jgi:hypothetical protein